MANLDTARPLPNKQHQQAEQWLAALARAIAGGAYNDVPHVWLIRGRFVGERTEPITPDSLVRGIIIRARIPYDSNRRGTPEHTAAVRELSSRIQRQLKEGKGDIISAAIEAGIQLCLFELIDTGKHGTSRPTDPTPRLKAMSPLLASSPA